MEREHSEVLEQTMLTRCMKEAAHTAIANAAPGRHNWVSGVMDILDLVLTNSVELISNVEVTPPRHSLSSDHYINYYFISTVVIHISMFQRKT